jgi:hypothetical protein
MTPENLARHKDDPNMAFWRMLKVGYDHFEVTRQVPKVDVCNKAYVFDADAGNAPFKAAAQCPRYTIPEAIATAVAAKQALDDQKFNEAVVRLAAEAQKEAEKAEKEAYAKEHPKPGLLSLWSHRETQPADTTAAPATTVIPPLPRPSPVASTLSTAKTATTGPAVAAATPVPRLKPSIDAMPAIKLATESKTVKAKTELVPARPAIAAAPLESPTASDPTAAAPTAVATDTTQPTIGTVVKKKWPDEDFGDPPQSATN